MLSRLARSDTSDEAAKLSHAQSWTDYLVDDLDDDLDDDSEDEFVEDYDDDDWDEPRAALGREPGGVRAIARRDASSLDGRRSGSERGREASRREGERFQLAASAIRAMVVGGLDVDGAGRGRRPGSSRPLSPRLQVALVQKKSSTKARARPLRGRRRESENPKRPHPSQGAIAFV